MAYKIGQFNQIKTDYVSTKLNNKYMTQLTEGEASTILMGNDMGINSSTNPTFAEQCIVFPSNLSREKVYYFNGIIKRLNTEQIFNIYLVNNSNLLNKQFIKTVVIQPGENTDWVDIEFTISPIIDNFNCILFKLERISSDYSFGPRNPILIYKEFSEINNLISNFNSISSLAKIGVQATPGLQMCINKESIYVGRTGLYEIRNNLITIDFFSIIDRAIEENEEQIKNLINITTESICLFNTKKLRKTSSFVLDYMYQE